MSSDSRIAVAKDCSTLPDSQPAERASGMFDRPLTDDHPPGSPVQAPTSPTSYPHAALWCAAMEADHRGTPGFPLHRLWDDLVRGRLCPRWESVGPDRILVVARMSHLGETLCAEGASILSRILCGVQQKVVACECGLAPSTVSGRYVRTLTQIEVAPRNVPLALVLAAQSASGIGPIATAKSCVFEHQRQTWLVVSVPRPTAARMTELTPAEQEVAQWIIEGYTRFAIARHRMTSVNTVARQFHSIFTRMKVRGRYSLIRRAVELRGFE
jgi:DNA-binding CsgD family transcriptional regulator